MIEIHYATVAIQIVLFLALWIVLSRLWIGPALRVMHERAARSEGAVAEARAIHAEAEKLRAGHAAALEQARAEAQREMQDLLRAAEAEQRRLITEAHEEAQRTLSEARGQLGADVASARHGLRDAAGDIARLVAAKVLGRPV